VKEVSLVFNYQFNCCHELLVFSGGERLMTNPEFNSELVHCPIQFVMITFGDDGRKEGT